MKRYLYLYLAAILAVAAALTAAALAADPGSREDPLASISYVDRYSQFERVELGTGQSIRIGAGCEFILVEPAGRLIDLVGFNPAASVLLNLSTGNRVDGQAVQSYQLYINGGEQPFKLAAASAVTLLVRGERE